MPVGPYSPDVMTHVINVQWGSPVFVFGLYQGGTIYNVKFDKADGSPTIDEVLLPGEVPFDPAHDSDRRVFYCVGSSFATVTIGETSSAFFLLAGGVVSETKEGLDSDGLPVRWNDSESRIFGSNDGQTWTAVHTEVVSPDIDLKLANILRPSGLVWDAEVKTFFYNQNHTTQLPSGSANLLDQVLASTTGGSWSQVASADTGGEPGFVSPFEEHCGDNRCIDKNENHVPDGVAWQSDTELVCPIAPPYIQYPVGGVNFRTSKDGGGDGGGKDTIEIIRAGVPPSTIPISGLAIVTCVAGAAGILMVGGYTSTATDSTGAVVYSLDDGAHWQSLMTTPAGVTTMTVGLI